LVQAGLATGVAALVTTLCMIDGTRRRWSDYSRYSEPTHLVLDGAFAVMNREDAVVALAAFRERFEGRLAKVERKGSRLELFPRREDDRHLADEVEVWLLEHGVPARARWRIKGSRSAAIQETIRRIGVLFTTAAVLCLLTGAVGLFAVQKAAADQRRVELAVRRVEGATRSDLLAMLLFEAVLLATLGLATGVPAGVGAGLVIERMIPGSGFAFPAGSVALFCGVLALLAVAFGLLPAWDAVRTEPSASLREA
jgi:predicted lysophospholipase L1 biosynthesis ABC-type transport system permease subunit